MNHDCIIGRHWEINREEGPCWVNRYTTTKDVFSNNPIENLTEDNIIDRFYYCPICGKKNKIDKKFKKYLLDAIK